MHELGQWNMSTYKTSIDRNSLAILQLEMIYALQARIVEDVSPWKPAAIDFTVPRSGEYSYEQ